LLLRKSQSSLQKDLYEKSFLILTRSSLATHTHTHTALTHERSQREQPQPFPSFLPPLTLMSVLPLDSAKAGSAFTKRTPESPPQATTEAHDDVADVKSPGGDNRILPAAEVAATDSRCGNGGATRSMTTLSRALSPIYASQVPRDVRNGRWGNLRPQLAADGRRREKFFTRAEELDARDADDRRLTDVRERASGGDGAHSHAHVPLFVRRRAAAGPPPSGASRVRPARKLPFSRGRPPNRTAFPPRGGPSVPPTPPSLPASRPGPGPD